MFRNGFVRLVAIFAIALTLAACKSAEERAEEHFQSALELIGKGDADRAIVEFRNVFELNEGHREARRAYADLLRGQGRPEAAYGQYLRLVEQYPDDAEGNVALAELAISMQNWTEARRYGSRAVGMLPEDPRVRAIDLNLRYADAVEAKDDAARRAVAEETAALIAQRPDDLSLRRIVIDADLRDGESSQSLDEIDAAMKIAPDDRTLWNTRLAVLARLNRPDEIEALLREMTARFPEDGELKGTLLRFYMSRGKAAEAEAFLREQIAATEGEEQTGLQVTLIRFLLDQQGAEAALAEIDGLLAGGGNQLMLASIRAGIRFDQGDRAAAISEMQALVDGAEATGETRQIKVALAKMLATDGNSVGARRLVEEVLAADPAQVEALKMKAAWLIQEDKTDEAIAALRTALDHAPDDVGAITLSAQAHDRRGDHDLARDFLSLAVEASNSAPETAIRYARALIGDKRYLPAEEVLVKALRITPDHPALLGTLGNLYIRMEDWPRAEQVEDSLRRIGAPETVSLADSLTAQRLAAQGRTEDSIGFLEGLAQGSELKPKLDVIQARLRSGDAAGALAYVRELAAADGENVTLQYALASVEAANGNYGTAETIYRAILQKAPTTSQAWVALIGALSADGRQQDALAAVEDGLKVLPDSPELLWVKSGLLERTGDIEGAIALNERLYELLPNSPIAANNLASLISSYRDDEASLERAYAVARRLKGSEAPAFQDTYGWIAARRGEHEEAVGYLESAAKGLPDDALVQFHLGMTYLALERKPEALAQLRHAVAVAGADDGRDQFRTAREEIARLETEGVVAPEGPPGASD